MRVSETAAVNNEGQNLNVTASARGKICELIRNADAGIEAVRVFVSGGGCSGMTYGMTFTESSESRDTTLEGDDGFCLVIDPVALTYMQGAEIDYSDDGPSANFVFKNVFNAVGGSGACGGCGGAGY
jgi:iron-sulfur cluster assembly accessory protein